MALRQVGMAGLSRLAGGRLVVTDNPAQACRQAGGRLGLAAARGLQTKPGSPDKVVLQGLVFHGYHGVLAEARHGCSRPHAWGCCCC